jgi:CheY-like chemotaxis protein/HPt (histidine-containing phosphotransfer) domain-containing protein
VHDLLTTFRFASQERLTRLRAAAESDGAGAGFLAHELQGAAASVGADRLAALACELESKSAFGDEAALRDLMRATIDELHAVVTRLTRADEGRQGRRTGTSSLESARQPSDSIDLTGRPGSAGEVGTIRPRRVLLVDDAPELRLLGRSVLAAAGYDVDLAIDGHDALARINAGDIPDVVVLDVQMPGLDGWDTLAAIRANPDTAALPVIMCSVTKRPGCRIRAQELGADGFVTKSYGVEHFERVVTQIAQHADEERARMRASRDALTG